MKGKFFIVIIIALLMTGGLALTSCAGPCNIEAGACGFDDSTITVCANKDCIVSKALNNPDDLDDSDFLIAVKDGCDCKK